VKRYFQSTVARNAIALYGIQAAQYILPWFTYPYLTRVLHPAGWGRILIAQAFVQFFVIVTDYGFNFTATREVAIHRNDLGKLSKILTSVTVAKLLLMTASLVAMIVIAKSVPSLRSELPLYLITFLTVIGNVIFPVWLFQGLEEMQFLAFREIGARLIGLLPTFLLVRNESDILWAAAVQSGSVAFAGLIGLFSVPRVTKARFVRVTTKEVLGTFRDGWHVFLSTAAITVYTRSNTFILGLIAPPAVAGYFGTALRLVDTTKGLVTPLSTSIFPHISRLSSEDPEGAINFIRRHTMRLMLPFFGISLALLAGAPLMIRVLNGKQYTPAIPLLMVMSPIPAIVSAAVIYATYYMLGLGYKKEWSRIFIQAGFVNFLVMLPLLRVISPGMTMAITATATEAYVLVAAYLFYRKTHRKKAVTSTGGIIKAE
jgi:PST family polysaccharide transporter